MNKKFNFRLIAGLIIVFALTVAFKNILTIDTCGSAIKDIVRYFMYFTMLSNISVATYFIGNGIGKKSFFFKNINVKFTLMVMMLITTIVYFIMLFKIEPTLLANIANFILHLFSTIFIFTDYILNDKKGTLKLNAPIKWASVFIFYVPYVIILSEIINLYPYPFIDLNVLPVTTVIITTILIILGFITIGYLLLGMDKLLAKIKK